MGEIDHGASDVPVASLVDEMVSKLLEGALATTGDLASVYTGAMAAMARLAWASRQPGVTPRMIADQNHAATMHFLVQVERHEHGGLQ